MVPVTTTPPDMLRLCTEVLEKCGSDELPDPADLFAIDATVTRVAANDNDDAYDDATGAAPTTHLSFVVVRPASTFSAAAVPQLPVCETALARRIAAMRLLPAGAQTVCCATLTSALTTTRTTSSPLPSHQPHPCCMFVVVVFFWILLSVQHTGFWVPHDGLDPQGSAAPPPRRPGRDAADCRGTMTSTSTHLSSLAFTHAGTTVPCRVVRITLLDDLC